MPFIDKSFLFYLKNWDVMEHLADMEEKQRIEVCEKSEHPNASEDFDNINDRADSYGGKFVEKIRDSVIESHLNSIGIKTKKRTSQKKLWERVLFFGKTDDDVKNEKWMMGFQVQRFQADICLLCYILRYNGKTKSYKPEIDRIFDVSSVGPSLYSDCSYLFYQKLPTDYTVDFEEKPIIQNIVNKAMSTLSGDRLEKLFQLNI